MDDARILHWWMITEGKARVVGEQKSREFRRGYENLGCHYKPTQNERIGFMKKLELQ